MTPAEAARRLGWSLLLGAGSGLAYDLLRVPGKRHRALADGLFLLAFAWGWLVLNFRICGGDIRMGCFWGQIIGLLLWEQLPGRYTGAAL